MHHNSSNWSSHPSFLTVAAAVALSIGATAASAQQAGTPEESELQDVVITGSRIRGIEPTGSAVIGIDRAEIVSAGTATTSDLLRKVPQIIGLGASETASSAQNGAANATRSSAVNLRGIGSLATLVLLDGRRLPPSGTQGQITDVSVIPAIALQRVEVVADGGSAIYGSDAITGVVNLIPRTNFVGQETSARFGIADGGYRERSVAHLAGFSWSGGHLMIAGEYQDHSGLDGYDRDFYRTDLRARGGSDFRANTCSPGTIVAGGVTYAIPAGSTGVGLTPANFTAGTQNLCDILPRGQIIPEVGRLNVMFSGTQDVTDSFSLFAQGYWSLRTFELRASGATATLTVPNTNPFFVNPSSVPQTSVSVRYDFANDVGLAHNPGHAKSYEGIVGGRYKISDSWRAEGYVARGISDDIIRRTNDLNNTTTGINAFLAQTNPLLAFNPFGSGGSNNGGVNASISNGQFIIQGDTALTVVGLQADGPVFQLPGGEVKLAVGAEYRSEDLHSLLRSGSTTAPVAVPGASSRNVQAVFGELYVPLVSEDNAMPLAQKLALSISGRYEKYSDFGNTSNPKIGLVWKPISALLVRSSWGTSFRAPGLAENDPRSGGYGLYGDTLPCTNNPPATTCFGIGLAGGNADLKPEDATTWSFGLELAPEVLPGLRASVNYFDIDYKNQIVGLRGTAGLLTNPLYADYRILNPTAAQISALVTQGLYKGSPVVPGLSVLPVNSNITGTVLYIQDGRRQNVGSTIAKGLDFDVDYNWDTSIGRFNVGGTAEYFTKFLTQIAPGAAEVDVRNTLNFPQRLRGRLNTGWSREALSVDAYLNFTSSYTQTGVTPIRKIDAYRTVDLSVSYDIGKSLNLQNLSGLSVSLNALNVLDEDPPFVNVNSGGYDPQSASPIGRLVAMSLRLSW